MKKENNTFGKAAGCLFIALLIAISSSCSYETRLLNKIPINSVKVKVVDQNGNPVPGAQVAASNGRQNTTDENGIAEIRFGTVGLYSVSVMADNHLPSNFMVTMPVDDGTTFTRRLTDELSFAGIRFGSTNIYPLLFNYMFSSFGYAVTLQPYEEGEYTVWKLSMQDDEGILTMHKAFLKKNEKGRQWWRIQIVTGDDRESSYLAEILFSKDRKQILRFREKIGDGEVQERPVPEGWYSKPMQLTEESIQGAVTKKGITVTVPAGDFEADLLKFGTTAATTLKLWRASNKEAVPGGVVKFKAIADEEPIYGSVLIEFGSGAETMLNSY